MATAALLADIREHLTNNPAPRRRFCQNGFLRKDLKQIASVVCEAPIPRNRLASVPELVPLDQVAQRLAALTGHPFEEEHIIQLWDSLQEQDLSDLYMCACVRIGEHRDLAVWPFGLVCLALVSVHSILAFGT